MNNFNQRFTENYKKTSKKHGQSDLVILALSNMFMITMTVLSIQNYREAGLNFLKFSMVMPLISLIYLFLRPQILDMSSGNKWSKAYINSVIVAGVLIGFIILVNSLQLNMTNFENVAKIIVSIFIGVSTFTGLFVVFAILFSALFPFLTYVRNFFTFRNEKFQLEKEIFLARNKQYLLEQVEREEFVNARIKPTIDPMPTGQRPASHPSTPAEKPAYSPGVSNTERVATEIISFMTKNNIHYLQETEFNELAKRLKTDRNYVINAINSSAFNKFVFADGKTIYSYLDQPELAELLGIEM